jgi:hypothetical protein
MQGAARLKVIGLCLVAPGEKTWNQVDVHVWFAEVSIASSSLSMSFLHPSGVLTPSVSGLSHMQNSTFKLSSQRQCQGVWAWNL